VADLALDYRPTSWDQVIGQRDVVRGLRSVITGRTRKSVLLIGPSGTGKTTLARLLATDVGCDPVDRLEIDGATNTGIDAMRDVTRAVHYKALGASPVKVVIVDEAHSLSKSAWQSLLKSVEEPPDHVWWVFCTTESAKIPVTIKTRCASFELRSVRLDDIYDLLIKVVRAEQYTTPEDVLGVIAREAMGSPRQALTYLGQCYNCCSTAEVRDVLSRAGMDGEAVDIARLLVKGTTWEKLMPLLDAIDNQSAESIRLVILRYLATIARSSKTDAQAGRALQLMDPFAEPYNQSDGFAPLLLSLGRVLYMS
jgi:DNA polymerase III subunit gamma/tau